MENPGFGGMDIRIVENRCRTAFLKSVIVWRENVSTMASESENLASATGYAKPCSEKETPTSPEEADERLWPESEREKETNKVDIVDGNEGNTDHRTSEEVPP